jgi:hypothetical protein
MAEILTLWVWGIGGEQSLLQIELVVVVVVVVVEEVVPGRVLLSL